jgi:uroporphyrinogen decarboxylase
MGIFSDLVLNSQRRIAMPILTFPGAHLIGATVRDLVTDPAKQVEAQKAIHLKYQTPMLLLGMDLSVEAEEFGADLHFAEDEIPTVVGRRVTCRGEIEALEVPCVGARRSQSCLEIVRQLAQWTGHPPVLGGIIGPFSLAGRLFGLTEIMMLTAVEPETVHLLLEKTTAFLLNYAKAQQAAGAKGIIMAEPSAGLLSPRSLGAFSSAYIQSIVNATRGDDFDFILHNCAARLGHLPEILKVGAPVYHFGAPMNIPAALASVPEGIILCGNLDPVKVFCESTPEQLEQTARELLEETRAYRNFVLSSGCDIPARVSLPMLDSFFQSIVHFPA